MSLKEQINTDFLTAYKSHNDAEVSTLRMLKSSIQNAEIAKKGDVKDEEVISILKREIKQRQDAIETYAKAGETEKADAEKAEIEIITKYLPGQLDEAEIAKIVDETIKELNATDMSAMGQVIGKIMKDHGSEVDGSLVSRLVKEKLQNK